MTTLSARPALPVSLYLQGKKVILVGDGALADEREIRLRDSNAQLERIRTADWDPERVSGAFLVMSMTDDAETDKRIAAEARAHGCLVYAHDLPDISDMAMPALVRRGPLKLAISTDATAPALARRFREILSAALQDAGPVLDQLMAELRSRRAELPAGQRGELYDLARTLQLTGEFSVSEPES